MADAPKLWKVLSNSDPSRIRTLFQGLEKDARAFIESHYPRAHVEPPSQDPGVPDVKLVSPDGVEDTYHAENGWVSENPDIAARDDRNVNRDVRDLSRDETVRRDDQEGTTSQKPSGFTSPPGQKPSSPELL